MIALLIGGESRLMDAMIDKLNKTGNRVYILTGKKNDHFSYKRVFEKYHFPYSSDSVKDIFESVRPDVVIFTGAFDTNYNWSKAREESIHYTSDLMNLLSACSLQKKGRFIYFSSQEVYGNSHVENISEEEPVTAKTFRAMAYAQGEEICMGYRKNRGMDTMVLRFDHLYFIPKKGEHADNPCFNQCLEALKTSKIQANERKKFSMIYLNDAVEYIYQIMMSEQPAYALYNLTSSEEISEMDLAELIQKEMGDEIEITNTTVGEGYRIVLDRGRYQGEFSSKIFVPYEKGVGMVARYMKRYSESFIEVEDKGAGRSGRLLHSVRRIIKALIPFLENLICFIPFFMLNNRAVGSQYFVRLDFYLLYVLLFAIVHGQQQAVFSALLSVAGYCFRQMYERSRFEVMMDYNTYVWMAQLFILGLVVGYMRDQLRHIRSEDEEEIGFLNEQLEDMADINDSNVRMKHIFENQIVNQKDSLGKVYEITSELDQYEPEEVLFYAADILSKLMDSKDVSIYTVANQDYARLFSFTSQTARKLGNSIKYSEMEDMYEELKERRVYINKKMDDRYPLMATAVYEEDQIQIILMLWGIPWERMNLSEANRLTVIAYLVQNAVLRANRYLEALKDRRYVEGTDVLDQDAFSHLVKAFFDAKKQSLTECTLLEILTNSSSKGKRKAAKILGPKVRQTDFLGVLDDGGLYVLLSNTDEEHAATIMERFMSYGYESRIREELEEIC